MQKFEEPVQNLRGDSIALAPMLVLQAGTDTPASIYFDAAGEIPIPEPRTDRTGVFAFYAPNGRYDVYAIINGVRIGHKLDLLMYDPADDVDSPLGGSANLVTFTPTGSGSVSRTVLAKLLEGITLADYISPDDAIAAAASKRMFIGAGESVVLNVPEKFATVQAALNAIAGWIIMGNLTIQVADGTYSPSGAIVLNHPYGNNCRLIGNVTSPANCMLSFASSDGIVVPTGSTWGEVNGFYVKKTGAKSNFGCMTFGGQLTKLGPNLVVDGFYYGIAPLNGGVIYADGTSTTNRVEVKNFGDVGIWAISGGFISAVWAYSHDGADAQPGNPLGAGFMVEFGGAMVCNNATATGNLFCGFGVNSGGAMRAWNVTSTGNGHGVSANSMGAIEIFGSTVKNNTWYGYRSDGMGQVYGWNQLATPSTGNGSGDHKQPMEFDPTNGAWKNNTGSLTVTAGPESATGGAVYSDMNATGATSNFVIHRALFNGTERGRIQYRPDFSLWEFLAGSKTLMRLFDTGKVTIGRGNTATTDTAGHLQIPKVAGTPTGVPGDIEGGFVPIVFDTTNNRLCVYNGGWKFAQFS